MVMIERKQPKNKIRINELNFWLTITCNIWFIFIFVGIGTSHETKIGATHEHIEIEGSILLNDLLKILLKP